MKSVQDSNSQVASSLHPEICQGILSPLGGSVAAASAISRCWAEGLHLFGSEALRPLCHVVASPTPGGWPTKRRHQADVALSRRSTSIAGDKEPWDWKTLAQTAVCPSSTDSSWRKVPCRGAQISPRQAVAACGAPSDVGSEAAILFGGNISNSVAGGWRTTDDLVLAKLPEVNTGACHLELIKKADAWPASRWGASLTGLHSSCYLVGGWSYAGDVRRTWALKFREAGVAWQEVPGSDEHFEPAAFHSATAVDANRMVVTGGLGSHSSRSGLWAFHEDTEKWSLLSSEGPSLAGHVAGYNEDTRRLFLFGGVQRQRERSSNDEFHLHTFVFDLRTNSWDTASDHPGVKTRSHNPLARRNAASAVIGNNFIISGGWNDSQGLPLRDTWCFDMRASQWSTLDKTPASIAPPKMSHKAVMSGFDFFCFGGTVQQRFEDVSMEVYALSLGQAPGEDSDACSDDDMERQLRGGAHLSSDESELVLDDENEEEQEAEEEEEDDSARSTEGEADLEHFRRYLATRRGEIGNSSGSDTRQAGGGYPAAADARQSTPGGGYNGR
eukprot:TRINITY_DN17525_c0_g1_i1.p1 TRINITY_DN17525_c0_g1~~TRINITY_DN17525_c0_g1_i1.p1  ORF type:complete len:556 (+),score=95.08 TRINITY_DN17525_c0_g1_i1:103-1770(+)